MTILVAKTTESTNDDARAAAASGAAHGTVIVADEQTKGRGRGDHVWHAPPGENLTMSIVLRPILRARDASPLALVVGLAVAEIVDRALGGFSARVKWPNDVLVDEKKIAGVLVEAQLRGDAVASVVAGIGLNLKTTRFPGDLAGRATSLALFGVADLDRDRFAEAVTATVLERVATYEREGLAPFSGELASRDALIGKAVRVSGIDGIAAGIEPDGRLRVRDARGSVHLVASGEVVNR